MIATSNIRKLFQSRISEARSPKSGEGHRAFLREWYETLGLIPDSRMRPTYITEGVGRYTFGEGRASPSEVSLRGLADAIMGHDFVEEYYHPSGGMDFGNRHIMEAAIDPTAFLNISTFNMSVAGLVNAAILERFNQPEYIGRNLVKIVPTKKNGDKLIGVARMDATTSNTRGRPPGGPHSEIGFSEAYQTTPETVEQALKCKVTREAVFFDLTGQVLDEANMVGDELGYAQDKDIADTVIGVTNSYNRNGTSYNTYQTSSPWVNDQSNELLDYRDVDESRQLFVGMTDPESGKEIVVNANTIAVMPAKLLEARHVLNVTYFEERTNSGARVSAGGNPLQGLALNVIELSAIWYNRATAADGLNLSAANAKKYWFHGDFQGAFEWRENWPLTPWQASADELTMKDHGLVAVYGANHRGKAYVREPRKVVRNKN